MASSSWPSHCSLVESVSCTDCKNQTSQFFSSSNSSNSTTSSSSSSSNVAANNNNQYFRLIKKAVVGNAEVEEYFSDVSGFRIFVCQVERPLVDGIFVVPTEAADDDGCAHALEHLVFLGSEKYPYSQVLDAMANRCLAESTNAWTETDHTAFTIATAGYEGFLNLLPVYLDHLLHPTLLQEAFITEVHHINGLGKNDGVVYSEMQDFEYDCQCIVERALKQNLYPNSCGYQFETGGRLQPLRALTNEKVKSFHKKFYRWDNVSLIVVGKVPIHALLSRIEEYARSDPSSLVSDLPSKRDRSPWSSPVPAAKVVKSPIVVKFPSEDVDDVGEVVWGWRGPEWNLIEERQILNILGEYLTHSNASPLQKAVVEVQDAIAGSVEFEEEPFKSTMYLLRFVDVPRRKASQIASTVKFTLQSLAKNGIDMDAMRATIQRIMSLFKQTLEEDPEEGFVEPLIEYIVNSPVPNPKEFEDIWKIENSCLNVYLKKPEQFWKNKLEEYFIKSNPIQIIGIPNSKLADRLAKEEDALRQQQLKLVELRGGRSVVQKIIADARAYHDTKPPADLIQSFPLASVDSVSQFEFKSISNLKDSSCVAAPEEQQPTQEYLALTTAAGGTTQPKEQQVQQPAQYNSIELKIYESLLQFPFPVHFCGIPSEFAELRVVYRIPDCLVIKEEKKEIHNFDNSSSSSNNNNDGKETESSAAAAADGVVNNNSISETDCLLLNLVIELLFETAVQSQYMKRTLLPSSRNSNGSSNNNNNSSSNKENRIVGHEEFSRLLTNHLTDHNVIRGVSGESAVNTDYPELLTISVCCVKEKIVEASELLLSVIKTTKYSVERIIPVARKLLGSLVRKRRRGKVFAEQLDLSIRFNRLSLQMFSSLSKCQSILRRVLSNPAAYVNVINALHERLFLQSSRFALQAFSTAETFLDPELLQNLKLLHYSSAVPSSSITTSSSHDNNKPNDVISSCAKERDSSSSPSASFFIKTESSIPCRVGAASSDSVANKFLSSLSISEYLDLPKTAKGRTEENSTLPFGNCVLGVSLSHDAGLVIVSVPGPAGANHPDDHSLSVLCEMLSSSEGLLYKTVRGGGFAYSPSVSHSKFSGTISLCIHAASDPVAALAACQSVFEKYTEAATAGNDGFKSQIEAVLQNSKSTVLFHIIKNEATLFDYVCEKFSNLLHDRPSNYTQLLLKEIQNVSLDSVLKTAAKYLPRFLSIEPSAASYKDGRSTIIVVNKTNVQEVQQKLRKSPQLFKLADDNRNEKFDKNKTNSDNSVGPDDSDRRGESNKDFFTKVEFPNFAAWDVCGDPTKTDAVKPIAGELKMAAEALSTSSSSSSSEDYDGSGTEMDDDDDGDNDDDDGENDDDDDDESTKDEELDTESD